MEIEQVVDHVGAIVIQHTDPVSEVYSCMCMQDSTSELHFRSWAAENC